MRTPNLEAFATVRPLLPTSTGVCREHVLPGDTHAGRDLNACAADWSTGGRTVFARLRVITPGLAHIAVLHFDEDGFGTLVSAPMTPGSVPAEVRAFLGSADQVVIAADGDGPVDGLLIDGRVERRDLSRLRLFEREVLGLVREDRDQDPAVWSAARDGDPLATRQLAASARADLFALACLAGGDITLH